MTHPFVVLLGFGLLLTVTGCSQSLSPAPGKTSNVAAAPNGIALPEGYQNWDLIAVSHRTDNNSLRAVLGNEIAIKAARTGQTNPWPEGSILGKLVWKDTVHEDDWPKATVPGEFVHAEFMFKDTQKYPQTGGWGFARWRGKTQIPYGEDKSFAQECFACHTPMKNRDYVFTRPAKLP